MENQPVRIFVQLCACLGLAAGAYLSAAQAPSAAAQADNVDKARATLTGYLSQTRSMRGKFRSVLLDEQRVPLAESSGLVAIKRPHRFRWEYLSPAPSLILADGVKLWSYDAELEQAVVRSMADMDGANPSNLLGGDVDVDQDFNVIGLYKVDDIEWVELEPKRAASDFTKVRLGFEGGNVVLMELGDQLGQTTQIQFTDIEVNVPIADDQFVFVPPAGTEIVGDD